MKLIVSIMLNKAGCIQSNLGTSFNDKDEIILGSWANIKITLADDVVIKGYIWQTNEQGASVCLKNNDGSE